MPKMQITWQLGFHELFTLWVLIFEDSFEVFAIQLTGF